MELLRSNTVPGAFHNSDDRRDPPKCHPHTREAVIKDIMDWVIDADRKEQFCWIYGPAGSGKSSIAQTIAELCEEQGRLASSFFFARTVPGRNTYTHLIPTLAYQLALFIPDIREYMAEVIQADGLIFTRSLPTQLDTVILKPLARLTSCNCNNSDQKPRKKPYPYLVIIDGLDECDGHQNQSYILSSFSSILKTTSVSLIFLVASRPEHAIRVAFNGGLHEHTRRLVLDKEYHPNEDIRVYLKSKFDEIKRVHPLASSIPSDWPATSQVENIVHNASGQFIYASTVVKFIKYHRDRPTKRLDIVLNNFSPGNHTPFADLDALYGHILSPDESMIETVLSLFAFMFATAKMDTGLAGRQSTQTPDFIEAFLGHEPGELLLALADLHSIVDVPSVQQPSEGVSTTRPLRLFHASLGDFLLDKRRSGRLYIDMEAYYTRFAISQIKVCLSDTNINFPQHILTGLALAVSMALDVSVQQSGIGVEKTLGLTVPVTKTTLPLSHSMPLSFFDHASDEKLLETTARRTQRRISDGVAYIMRAFDPKRGTNWWLFLGIVPNNTQLPFRDLYARINHYLRLVHFLTHEDYTDGLSTVDNTQYLIDSHKVSDFAIRLFDILTADLHPSHK
ncbi:hypothetical protein CVT25_010501 [Psilocybe cyanescens]|uniref:Nephrocystin 3-like N-terminal domain-containing protein n=1 Tax=Psilocybe cyanescens TaxID=93625 RepID=A0A409X2M0_PSICY|nr:hypothetical protein CVT25_010501 [Psilocybe cyanescens]